MRAVRAQELLGRQSPIPDRLIYCQLCQERSARWSEVDSEGDAWTIVFPCTREVGNPVADPVGTFNAVAGFQDNVEVCAGGGITNCDWVTNLHAIDDEYHQILGVKVVVDDKRQREIVIADARQQQVVSEGRGRRRWGQG
ncbi:hypothetical protein D3C77_532850 [compost metagenome]